MVLTPPTIMVVVPRRCGWTDKGRGGDAYFQRRATMETRQAHAQQAPGMRRRDLLKAGLVAGVTLSAGPLAGPVVLWGAEAGPPKRGGILHVRGRDPVHFDPHLTINVRTQSTLSFVYSKLVRHE